MDNPWNHVEQYLDGLLVPEEQEFASLRSANERAGLPAIDVPPSLGKLLGLLIRISGARRVLEVGTLGGYSTIWMARALPPDGRVLTLEISPKHAEIARENFAAAGLAERIEVRVGPASETLEALCAANEPSFDLIFLDADKKNLPQYLDFAMRLAHPGTILIADNVVRDGKVTDRKSFDPDVLGVQEFLRLVSEHPRLDATALQTVGARGYDGFALAVVLP